MPSPEATFWLAIYGAVLSTSALLWNIVRDILDRRSRLRLTVAVVNIVSGYSLRGRPHVSDDQVCFTVTNLAGADAQIQQIGSFGGWSERWSKFRSRSDWSVIMVPGLPRRLASVEKADLMMPLLPDAAAKLQSVRRIWVQDSLGRRHYASRSNLRALRKQLLRSTALDRGQSRNSLSDSEETRT